MRRGYKHEKSSLGGGRGWLTGCVCILGVLLIKNTAGLFLDTECIVFSFKNDHMCSLLKGNIFVISFCIIFFKLSFFFKL